MSLILKWRRFFQKGHERTIKAKKNVVLAVFLKGAGVLIGFLYFPLGLAYLDPVKFGIFLTMASMIDWFRELDVGIGSGLRNRLGEAFADGDDERAQGYVSTAYFFVGSIFSVVTLLFVTLSYFLPWSDWLQTDPALNSQIAILAMLMFGAFAIRFVSSLVYQVFYALQRTAMIDLFSFYSKLTFLFVIIYLLYFTENNSLLNYGVAKTFTFACVPLLVGIYYYRGAFKQFRPSFRKVKKAYFKDLFSLGFQFFIIKMSMLVVFVTNNFLIARFVSVEEVPPYEAAYKFLSVFLMIFVILTNQMWSANLEAYRKGELDWMKKSLKGIRKIWFISLGLMALALLISPFFFELWLQGKIEIPILLTFGVAISVAVTNWVHLHNLVLNGAGKIKMQMIGWIVACIINIPISIFYAEFLGFGTIGIVMGTITSLIPMAIFSPIQVRKILNRADNGIWSK